MPFLLSSYNPQKQAPTSLWWSLGCKTLLFDPQLGQKTSSFSFLQLPNSTRCFHWEQGRKTACYFSSLLLQPCEDNRLSNERGDPISCQRTTHLITCASFAEIKGKGTLNVVSILQMQMQTALFVVRCTAKHKPLLHFTTSLPLILQPWTQNRIMLVSYQFMDSWSTSTLIEPEGLTYDR